MDTIVIPGIPEEVITEAMALPADEVQKPKRLPQDLLADATRVIQAGKNHEEKCIVAGLGNDMVAKALVKNDAFRVVSGKLDEADTKCKGDQAGYNKKNEKAMELRAEMFTAGSHALRKNPEELQKLRDIKEGTGKEDIWYDFEKLAVLGEQNADAFAAIGFDTTKFAEARKLAKELPEEYNQLQFDMQSDSELCDLRNRIYTLLIPLVIEIRDCGKYAFHNDKEVQKRFNFSIS